MLFNSLTDIPIITLLRSDKILMELLEIAICPGEQSQAYLNSVKDFYPNRFRKGAMALAINSSCTQEKFSLDYDYSCLDDIYNFYYIKSDLYIEAKIDELERYTSLINKIHPFNVIGYKLACLLNENDITFQDIDKYTSTITPLGLSNKIYKQRYSDNHIHLGGANENIANLLELLDKPTDSKWYKAEFLETLPRISMFSHINNGQLSIGSLIDIAKIIQSEIHKSVIIGIKEQDFSDIQSIIKRILYGFSVPTKEPSFSLSFINKSNVLNHKELNRNQKLLADVICYFDANKSIKQWFAYNIFLHHLHLTSTNIQIKSMIKIFFHISNILRAYQIMNQNIGLGHFSEFSRSKVRQTFLNSANNIAENIINTGTHYFEAKTTSNTLFNGGVESFIKSFDKYIQNKEHDEKGTYHFCIHFIRKKEEKAINLENIPSNVRHYTLRMNLKNEAKRLHDYLYKQIPIIKKDPSLVDLNKTTYYFDMSKLIRSLDVAGDETLTPPEVFSPILRYLCDAFQKVDQNGYRDYLLGNNSEKSKRLSLSVHAGEDFDHILTGIRRVDETIRFYDMQEEDRIGHALAIGLDPKKWVEMNGDIFMTKLELLDNYVWLIKRWKDNLVHIKNYNDIFKSRIDTYIEYIEILSNEIYGRLYDIDVLYEAWELRKFCPIETFSSVTIYKDDYLEKARADIEKTTDEVLKVFKDYHMDPNIRKNGDQIITIRYRPKKIDDYIYICDDDLDIIHAIQDYMIEDVAQNKLIIETNPTSNIYIAQLNSFREHPIFRWCPVDTKFDRKNKFNIRENSVKVCVNTDDPAIMPTTLPNEYKALESAAIDLGYKLTNIKDWLENIRMLGNCIFQHSHQKFKFEK